MITTALLQTFETEPPARVRPEPPVRAAFELARRQPTRDAFVQWYVEALHDRGLDLRAIVARKRALECFLASLRGPPHEATPEAARRYFALALSVGTPPARLRLIRTAITEAFDELSELAIGAALPPASETGELRGAKALEPPPLRVVPKRPASPERARRRRARRAELARVLAEEVGLEPREIARLRWSEVDLDRQLVHVPSPHQGRRRMALTKRAHALLARAFRRSRDPLGPVIAKNGPPGRFSARYVRGLLASP